MFTNWYDNRKLIWTISVQYQSDAKWVGEQKGIIHFCSNSIAVNLFIFRRSRTILNHGLSSFFSSLPPGSVRFGKTLAARGLEEPCASFPDFCDNRILLCFLSFMYVLYFEEFLLHDSRGFMIFWRKFDPICWVCAIFLSIPNLQACTDKVAGSRSVLATAVDDWSGKPYCVSS